MGKLPSTVLRRPCLAAAGSLSSATAAATPTLTTPTTTTPAAAAARLAVGSGGQVRHATFVPRPRRPYQFTQLVQLSDGSTFTVRTTSPVALYRSAKDSRNHVLWQPSEKSLRNVEVDEAGKLAAFRGRFGHSWDLEGPPGADKEQPQPQEDKAEGARQAAAEAEDKGAAAAAPAQAAQQQAKEQEAKPAAPKEDAFDSLVDLISAYAVEDKNVKGGLSAKDQAKKDKKK